MGFYRGPQIVRSGLVFYLDAGNPKSYSGGLTWSDISGFGNNTTLINGPTFSAANNGNIILDGVNDYVVSDSYPDSLLGNPTFSVGGFFKKSGSWSGGATWGIGRQGMGICSWNYASVDHIAIDFYGTSTYTTNQTYSSTDWKHIIWTYNGGGFTTANIIIYINGTSYTGAGLSVLRGGTGTPNITSNISNKIVIGKSVPNENLYYGKPIVSNFMIYNRVLTQAEVLENFNAQKSRFGL